MATLLSVMSDFAASIRAVGAAASIAADEVEVATDRIERSQSRVTGGSSNTGGLGARSGGSGSSGSTMTGGSPIATAISAEIRRIVR